MARDGVRDALGDGDALGGEPDRAKVDVDLSPYELGVAHPDVGVAELLRELRHLDDAPRRLDGEES